MAESIPLIMGLISFVGGGIAWYSASVRKRYAAERDFNHLRNSYDNLANNVTQLDRMLDQRMDELQRENMEIKTLIQSVILRSGNPNSWTSIKKD